MRQALAVGLLAVFAAPAILGAAAPQTMELELLGTADLHGHLYPTNYFDGNADAALGLAKVATLIRRERATHPHVLLVDSGDLLEGSPLTDWFVKYGDWRHHINPMIAAMNQLGYAAFTVGNHDFDYGLPFLYKARRDANFPFVCANAYRHGTKTPVFEPYVMADVAGLKVGLIGTTPPGVALWDRSEVAGRLDIGDVEAAFKRAVPELEAKGADLIVGIPHAGFGSDGPFGPTYDGYARSSGLPPEQVGSQLARDIPDLAALLLGHSHQNVWSKPGATHTVVEGMIHGRLVAESIPRPIAIAQADKWGSHLAVIRLGLIRQDGKWVVTSRQALTLSTKGVPPDPGILAIGRSAQQATLRFVQSPIATTPDAWSAQLARFQDTPVVRLIQQVQRERTGAQLSAAADFDPAAGLTRGPITIAEVAALYPYDNALVAVRITGKQLRAYLEQSARYFGPDKPGAPLVDPAGRGFNDDMVAGVDYRIDLTKPPGSRIVGLAYHGRPVTASQSFTMALNSYRQRGGGGFDMLRSAPVVYNRGENIRDLIVAYLQKKRHLRIRDLFSKAHWALIPASAWDTKTLRYR
ncbi:MAG: 5'-nucleotidase C-terminal domain-containing protein [Cyanobacteria bacterium REEB65]|nr:5'-nucleotidase C-terminal domain-containing protein [Cyanobacteria bacterium REEB65]